MKSKQKTKEMVLLTLFACIEIILMLTPLGYIPIGVVRATTLHIPVILAGILLGAKGGGIIGLVFGITSVIINTLTPTITSFVFSPFYSVGEFHGGIASLLIAIGPRVLLGLSSAWIYQLMLRLSKKVNLSLITSAVVNTLIHTILVLGGIYLFFGSSYAAVKEVSLQGLFGLLCTLVATNGVLETLIAGVIVLAVGRALLPLINKKEKSSER